VKECAGKGRPWHLFPDAPQPPFEIFRMNFIRPNSKFTKFAGLTGFNGSFKKVAKQKNHPIHYRVA
jgi:hypothetical protein